MGTILIKGKTYDVECIIFDKDGTLIDLQGYWVPRFKKWVEKIAASFNLDRASTLELYKTIGYDHTQNSIIPESPLAVASLDTLYTLISDILIKHGLPGHEVRALVEEYAQETVNSAFEPNEIIPKGSITQVISQLSDANIKIAIVTSDDRANAEKTLTYFEVSGFISAMVCGDDPVPNKPSPEAAEIISKQLNTPPGRMMMVGDSRLDMQFAKNAGIAYRIAVAPDSQPPSHLAAISDEVIFSIDELEIPRQADTKQ